MGGCQNYGPFLGPYYNTAPIIIGTQKGTIILTISHMVVPHPIFRVPTFLFSDPNCFAGYSKQGVGYDPIGTA